MTNPVVGLAQIAYPTFPTGHGDLLGQIKRILGEASERGANIVCFPETFNQMHGSTDHIAEQIALICREYGLWVVFGTAMSDNYGLRNSAIIISNKGETAGIYHKQHLLGGEKDWGIVAGKSPVILETEFGRLGIMICYDIFSSKVVSQYEDKGVQIILCPSNMVVPIPDFRDRQREIVTSLATAISTQLNCFFGIAMAHGKGLISESKVVSPRGIIAESDQEGLVFSEVPADDLAVLPVLDMTQKEQAKFSAKLQE